MTRLALAVMLVVAAGPLGCLSVQKSVWFGEERAPATREELYDRFGPPSSVVRDGEERLLRYDHARVRGLTLGFTAGLIPGAKAGVAYPLFEMSRRHRVSDHIWVRLGPDDRVLEVIPQPYAGSFRYRLWPFGD